MNILAILFTLFAFTIAKGMVLAEESPESITVTFPTLDPPTLDFIDLSGGCSGFFDCTEYLANVVYNIGLGVIYLLLLIIDILVFVFELLQLLVVVTFTGIEGAPFWVNLLISLPYVAGLGFIIYKLIRSGSSNA